MNLFRKVLAAVDLGDENSSVRVVNAALETIEDGDTLHVMSVVPDFGSGVVASFFSPDHEEKAIKAAQEAIHAFTQKHVTRDVPIQHIIGHGSIYEQIVETAEQIGADLIVIGSHRPDFRDFLLGPNAERVVRHCNRSVLVVRGLADEA